MKFFYWHVELASMDSLLVTDESGVIYYLSLGKWAELIDIMKRDFRSVLGHSLHPGQPSQVTPLIKRVKQILISILEGSASTTQHEADLTLKYVFGTKFQRQIWDYLRKIPLGQTATYSEIASAVGRAGLARGVGNACAANRIALLVPCHRVLGTSGGLTGYRWGVSSKQELIAQERRLCQAEKLTQTKSQTETRRPTLAETRLPAQPAEAA